MGYDNIVYSNLITHSLSTIHHDMEEIGKVVANNLLHRIENGEYLNMRQVIDPELLPRESVIDIRQKENYKMSTKQVKIDLCDLKRSW